MKTDYYNSEEEAAAPLGLYDKSNQDIIPLYFIDIDVEIMSRFARIHLTHKYFNPTDKAIDTIFKFPKGYFQVFDRISALIDGKEVVGIIAEKQKIKYDFDKAKKEGKTVIKTEAISSNSKVKADLLIAEIGNIPPKKEINVTFSFIQKLEQLDNKSLQLILPLALTPRYVPSNAIRDLLSKYIYEGIVDETTIKSIVNSSNIKYIPTNKGLEYQYDVRIKLKSGQAIKSIVTPMKRTQTIIQMIDQYNAMVTLDVSKINIPNADFVLKYQVIEDELLKPYMLLMKHPKYDNDYALYYSFNPYYNFIQQSKGKVSSPLIEDFKGNFLFLLDRSGSMYGNRIEYAKTSLIYFLKSLPNESFFNVISFGSEYSPMFNNFAQINDNSIEKAIEALMKYDADMGGTELYPALYFISQITKKTTIPTRVFVLTDGAVYNTDECLYKISDNTKHSSIQYSCLGIGNGCSETLVKGIAQEGGGNYEFVKNEIEMTEKVINMLENSMKHYLNDFTLTFDDPSTIINTNIKEFQSRSKNVDSPIEFYAMMNSSSMNEITCSYSIPGITNIKQSFTVKIDLSKAIACSHLHKHIIDRKSVV